MIDADEVKCNSETICNSNSSQFEITPIIEVDGVADLKNDLKISEATVKDLQNELINFKSKYAEETAIKKKNISEIENLNVLVTDLKSEIKVKVDHFKKQLDDNKKEKESIVLKYAQSEQKTLEGQKKIRDLEGKLRDLKVSLENNIHEKERVAKELKARSTDFSSYERELNNLKASITIAEQKLKTEESKFKDEFDKNKELKRKYDELQRSMIVIKEENNTLRSNCQEIVKTYQDSEDMRSNSLSQSLKQMKEEMRKKEDERKELTENYSKNLAELKNVKTVMNTQSQELRCLKDKMKHLEAEKLCLDESVKQLKDSIKSLSLVKDEQSDRLKILEPLEKKIEMLNEENSQLSKNNIDLRKNATDTDQSLINLQQKESELLTFIQNLSDKNAKLQSEKQDFVVKCDKSETQIKKLDKQYRDGLIKTKYWEDKFKEESKMWMEMNDKLNNELSALKAELNTVKINLSDANDQISSLNKKHKAHIKDLTRQLLKSSSIPIVQSQNDKINSGTNGGINHKLNQHNELVAESEKIVIGSHTNSLISQSESFSDESLRNSEQNLNTTEISMPNTSSYNSHIPYQNIHITTDNKQDYQAVTNTPEIHMIEPQNQVLVEKIVRLQRQNARLHDKIDFLTEHSNHLTQDIQNKSTLIKHLFSQNVEQGSVKPETVDQNHWMMVKRGGSIMASVFSSRPADEHMTLELSLEITNRLQSVLEDTTMKNITLKENINTLGEEISKLTKENHVLKSQSSSI